MKRSRPRTPRWEPCMLALVEAAAHHPELAAMIARLTGQILLARVPNVFE